MRTVEHHSTLEAAALTSLLTVFISDPCNESIMTDDWRGRLTHFLMSFPNSPGFHWNQD